MSYLVYLLIGVVSGTLSGLLGIGGGVIVVPALLFWFQMKHLFSNEFIMHVATGTSLATMIATTFSSANAYYRRGLIVWPIFVRFFPGLCAGMLLGSVIGSHVSSRALINAFAVFLLLMAIQLPLLSDEEKRLDMHSKKSSRSHEEHFRSWGYQALLIVVSCFIGSTSTLFGVGGGLLIVPFLLFLHLPMNKSSGTSAMCSIPTAILGTIMLTISGASRVESQALPWGTIGYVYWPAAMSISLTSVFFAPLGTRCSVHLKPLIRKIILSCILIFCSFNMLF